MSSITYKVHDTDSPVNEGSQSGQDPKFVRYHLEIYFIQSYTVLCMSLRKHANSNILNISPPKTESFQIKILIFFKFLLKT